MNNKDVRTDFYIYILIDPQNNKPFYVGYGLRNRLNQHWNLFLNNPQKETNLYKRNKFIQLLKRDLEPICLKVKENLTHKEALIFEKLYIKKYGTKYDKSGILCNFTKGGDGGYHPNNKNPGNCPELYIKLMKYIDDNVRGKKIENIKHIESMRKAALNRTIHGMDGKNHSEKTKNTLIQKSIGNSNASGKWSDERIQKHKNSVELRKSRTDNRFIVYKSIELIFYIFDNQKIAKEYLNIPNAANISSVLCGKEKTKYGYIFKYIEDGEIIKQLKSKNYEECESEEYKKIRGRTNI